jgi:hypothetical protein
MLEDQGVDGALAPDLPATSGAYGSPPPPPDPVVADSARLRLAALRAQAAARPVNQFADTAPVQLINDIRAVAAVLAAVRGELGGPAEAIDVGAGLVVLCDLRAHLDELEAGLLDAAQRVGLNWDVVAAIIGIPADEAQRRHQSLRGRRPSPQP